MARRRLDLALVRRGLAETRERAQHLISAGLVRVAGSTATRASTPVADESPIEVIQTALPYVSRGGLKLAAALDRWSLGVAGLVALDVGASTGGFTDVLLQRGARRVYAVDVGYGQLHYRLRGDPRVVLLERTNVRHLQALPEAPAFGAADVSFISLRLALPPALALLAPEAVFVALVKPQFEAGRGQVGKGGVVRDPAVHRAVLEGLVSWSAGQSRQIVDLAPSPIRGPAGNLEFLSLWRPGEPAGDPSALAERALAEAACTFAGSG